MAAGIFAILDDIGALLDDVAAASKVATGKTAGILGDDLAVNAEKATGFVSSRELPVLWAITKGSFLNKLIIVPIALLLNAYLPIAIQYILIFGGAYLAYEGVEKIIEFLFHRKKKPHPPTLEPTSEAPEVSEKQKIKSAIATDFILSIEIVIIALGSVLKQTLPVQIITVVIVAILATIGVYGFVALIVRMDDAGYLLIRVSKKSGFLTKLGHLLVSALPIVIRVLSVVGTLALLLVAGGIFTHSISELHHFLPTVPDLLKELFYGLIVGSIVFLLLLVFKKVKLFFVK